jgi:hypothetical protein
VKAQAWPSRACVVALALACVAGRAIGADVEAGAADARTVARALVVDDALRQLCNALRQLCNALPGSDPVVVAKTQRAWSARNLARVQQAADRLHHQYEVAADAEIGDARRAREARAAAEGRIMQAFLHLRAQHFPDDRGDAAHCAAYLKDVERGVFDALPPDADG